MTDSSIETMEWRSFAVGDRAACMWGVELSAQNDRFLTGIDPSFFNYLVETHVPLLDGPNRQRAALAIRTTYSHALETFFALLLAAIQAPHCPLGWVMRYRPGELAWLARR